MKLSSYKRALAIGVLACLPSLAQNPVTAVLPGAPLTDQYLLVASDNATSSLMAAITSTTQVIPVSTVLNFVPFMVVTIDSEIMQICSVGSFSLTVCSNGRGFSGTLPANHGYEAAVNGNLVSYHVNVLDSVSPPSTVSPLIIDVGQFAP
jgi:hypothetical protein